VLLTPDRFEEIKKIVFLFDGHYTSVYALKMFNYLLPSFKNLPIEIIAVKNMGADWHIPENNLTKEYIKRHFKHCTYTVLKGIPEVEIVKHLSMERLPFLSVLGAYRRSMLSRWFRSSMADALVENFEHPLFIAHNK
jgi:hypothetical protein